MRGTYTSAPRGVRHLLAAYELGEDKLDGHIKPRKTRTRFPGFCRYLRSLYPPEVRIAIICDNFSLPRTTTRDSKPLPGPPRLNRIEAQFTALPTSRSTAPTMPATKSRPA
jgi:hypothetical protein